MKITVAALLKKRKDLPDDFADYVHLISSGEHIVAEVESFSNPDAQHSVSLQLLKPDEAEPVEVEIYDGTCSCPASKACKHMGAAYLVAKEKAGEPLPEMAKKALLKETIEKENEAGPYLILQCEDSDKKAFGLFLFDSFYFGGTEDEPSDYDIREWWGCEIVYVARTEEGKESLVCTKVRPSAAVGTWKKEAVLIDTQREANLVTERVLNNESNQRAAEAIVLETDFAKAKDVLVFGDQASTGKIISQKPESMKDRCDKLRAAGKAFEMAVDSIAGLLEDYGKALQDLLKEE